MSGSEPSTKSEKKKLSRPERKALEREAKEAKSRRSNKGHRHHNFAAHNKEVLSQYNPKKEGPYDLHSQAVSSLNKNSTADDVMRAIKRAQNLHDVHDIANVERFLLEEVDCHFAYGYRGSLLARLAVAALHMSNHDLARKAIEVRKIEHRPAMMPMESAAIIRGLLRVHNATDAIDILNDELSLPLKGTAIDTPEAKDKITHRSLAITSIASRHFFELEPYMAVKACKMLAQMGPIVRNSGLTAKDINIPWKRLLRGAAQCEGERRVGNICPTQVLDDVELPVNLVYSVLNAMTTFPPENRDDVYEILSNALVRRTNFITGAVSMDGMPKADRGEAVFIGRSNVGKSSLVNMVSEFDFIKYANNNKICTYKLLYKFGQISKVTNRKSLAYTSKRPGKTQQFNFFGVNDKIGIEKELRYGDDVPGEKDSDSFYIVDLPGFGFAKVPELQRQRWSDLMAEYLTKRKTIRAVFHLVDARHGPIDEDVKIMRQVGETLPKHATYVVVLTKADKNVKDTNKKSGRVSKDVLNKLRETMRGAKVGNSPVILTSSASKLGRDDIWRYLKLAADL